MALRRSQGRCAHLVARRFFVSKTFRVTAILWIASIAYDFQTGCQKKIVRVFVGETHTHSSPFRNASAPVSVLCSKLEVNDPIKCKCTDEARSTLLGAGVVCPVPAGRCAGLVVCVIFLV